MIKRYKKNGPSRGEDHYCAKLTNEKVKAIRIKYAKMQGSFRKLAKEYDVGYHTIEAAIYGITWRTAGGPIQAPRRLQKC
jgi:hypothetical protein